jgi:hypothetical protein
MAYIIAVVLLVEAVCKALPAELFQICNNHAKNQPFTTMN